MDFLFEYTTTLIKTLNVLDKHTLSKIHSVDLDCGNLPVKDFNRDNGTITFLDSLASIINPTLYWFEIISSTDSKAIYDELKNTKATTQRNFPAIKRGFCNWETNVLYVGKVKTNLKGRMLVHLGYYKNAMTQGLQLCYWAPKLNLKLKLHYIVMPVEFKNLMELYERQIAIKFKPICGKHK
ncbi:MAG: hypothetical protein ACTHJ0_04240 [Flavipsychrobacter sp.]